jgi:hypothetical protein
MVITPSNRSWWLRLTLQTPLSHHDPDNKDKSNKNLFRRMAKVLRVNDAENLPTQEQIDRILTAYPVPLDIADLFAEVTLPQFLAVAALHEFITRYGGQDGNGLFSGTERYRRLEERFQQSAVQAHTLLELWGMACNSLQVPNVDHGRDANLLRLLNTPAALAGLVLKTLADTPRPLVMLARLWGEQAKLQNEAYATKAGVAKSSAESVRLAYPIPAEIAAKSEIVVELPTFSANSLRHEMVREPGMWHLFNSLGIGFDEPLPAMTAMFYNGGDIKAGATQPSDVFWLRKVIRERYPLLALISGGTDSFLVGESNLHIHSWVRCRENNDVLGAVGLDTTMSIFDAVDEWTLTRHANRVESGQMPFSFETLAAGTEIAVRLSVTPYADNLQIGALMAALNTYQESDSALGGQPARGFGLMALNWHDSEMDSAAMLAYQDYVDTNRDALRAGILDGMLWTGKKVMS